MSALIASWRDRCARRRARRIRRRLGFEAVDFYTGAWRWR